MLFFPFGLFAQNTADKILGNWKNEEANARFEITKTDSTYSAKVTWLAEPLDTDGNPKTDKRNPDKTLRTRPIIGIDIFTGLKFDNGIWNGTEIYSPEKGISAKLKIELPNDSTLKITGSKGIFSQTKICTRL
jgi:uncharacterized protein (DUF2147 family)